jgi:hypothetical protein
VRSKISSETGVSAGNLTKVKHLRTEAHPRVEQALRDGVISIHKAWCLSHLPRLRQVRELEDHQTQKGVNKTSCQLIRKHVATLSLLSSPAATLAKLLSPSTEKLTAALDSIAVAEIDFPGKIAYFTSTDGGWHANGWNTAANLYITHWLGGTADFSGVYNSGSLYTYTFGPVVSTHKSNFSPLRTLCLAVPALRVAV